MLRLTVLIFMLAGFSLPVAGQHSSPLELNVKKIKYNFFKDKLQKDTNENKPGKGKVQNVNTGGIFLSPSIGFSFPVGKFGDYSISGLSYGAKLELAYSRLYPFIFGFVYDYQKNPGSGDFTTSNFLTQFDTKITSIGGSLDIILNKFFKSNFTTPIFSLEIKYAKVDRDISPAINIPGILDSESLITYAAGMGFTIYILDLGAKYTFAKDYTNLTFQAKFHLPIIRF